MRILLDESSALLLRVIARRMFLNAFFGRDTDHVFSSLFLLPPFSLAKRKGICWNKEESGI